MRVSEVVGLARERPQILGFRGAPADDLEYRLSTPWH